MDITNVYFTTMMLLDTITFNYTIRYIDDVLSLNNKNFSNFLHLIYAVELVVKDTNDSPNSAS